MSLSKNMKMNIRISRVKFGWHDIDWISVEKNVFRQQVKIGVAYKDGNTGLVTQ